MTDKTISAQELRRARTILLNLHRASNENLADNTVMLAQAIREAQNEAYEQAAKIADPQPGLWPGREALSAEIRDLKHSDGGEQA